jgi:ribonuclease-3
MDPADALKKRLGLPIRDMGLLGQALVHSSWLHEHPDAALGHNERLEFLGDAVLQLAVTHLLMEAGPNFSEGELSLWRSQVVSEVSLSQLAAQIELGQFLVLGRGEEQSGGRAKPSLLADAYEAVIGAVYKDTGFDYVLRLLRRLLGPVLARVLLSGTADYKSALQELLQRTDKTRPRYEVVDAFGPDHEKTFTVAVYCNDVLLGTASGRSKREAEHRCAALALGQLQSGGATGRTAAPLPTAPGDENSSAEPTSDAVRSGAPR